MAASPSRERLIEQGRNKSPWLHGAAMAAAYAGIREPDMRRLIATNKVISRRKPPREDGSVPRGLLIYAPSIDELILEQPSGANVVALALEEVS